MSRAIKGRRDHKGTVERSLYGYDGNDYYLVDVDSDGRQLIKNQVVDPDTLEWVNQQGGGTGSGGEVEVQNWPASQTVSGPVTDAELRASDVKVSLDGESVAVTGPLTDTQLRATDVKITLDGEQVSVSNFPGTQPVSAASLPLPSGASTAANQATLESLIDTLQELIQRLAPIGSWNNSGAAGVRVVGVSMPSTAVTGPLTNAQYIATPLVGAVHYTQRTGIENTAAVLSNINNCTGA